MCVMDVTGLGEYSSLLGIFIDVHGQGIYVFDELPVLDTFNVSNNGGGATTPKG